MIRACSLEALVEKPERSVAGPVVGLGGQKNLTATLAQGGTVVIEASGIGRRRVAVGHALVECAVDDSDGLARCGRRCEAPLRRPRQTGSPPGPCAPGDGWESAAERASAVTGMSRCVLRCGHAEISSTARAGLERSGVKRTSDEFQLDDRAVVNEVVAALDFSVVCNQAIHLASCSRRREGPSS